MEWRSEWNGPTFAGLIGCGVGFGIGYIVCSRRKDSIIHYVKVEHEPVTEYEEGMYDTTSEAESGAEVEIVIIDQEVTEGVTVSVFPVDDPNWDYDEENKHRGREAPYIIHRDEFQAQENDYGQSTLTYYAGDEILVDEEDVPIHRHEKLTGPLEFGKGSGDPNVVYIRNDHNEAEYEVIKDGGHYAVEVLGHDIEDFHAKRDEKPIIHKMRQD